MAEVSKATATKRPRCRATRRDGQPCTATVPAGRDYCAKHDAGARIDPRVLPYLFRAALLGPQLHIGARELTRAAFQPVAMDAAGRVGLRDFNQPYGHTSSAPPGSSAILVIWPSFAFGVGNDSRKVAGSVAGTYAFGRFCGYRPYFRTGFTKSSEDPASLTHTDRQAGRKSMGRRGRL